MKIILKSSKDLGQPRSLWSNAYLRNQRAILNEKIRRAENKIHLLKQQLNQLDTTP